MVFKFSVVKLLLICLKATFLNLVLKKIYLDLDNTAKKIILDSCRYLGKPN